MARTARALATLSALAVLAGCGQPVATSHSGSAGMHATGTGLDDMDLVPDVRAVSLMAERLQSEAIVRSGSALLFGTHTTSAHRLGTRMEALTLRLSGRFTAPDLAGRMAPVANATAWVLVDGRAVASALTDATGTWSLAVDRLAVQGRRVSLQYQLANPRWKIRDDRYQGPELSVSEDTDVGTTALFAGTANAQSVWIHEIYNRVQGLFERTGVGLTFWNRQLDTRWPAQGNYYSWGTVNLSNPEWWDVNGHEIGHAMHDLGINGRMGGGQHKIDECYSTDLAWSEGFASFVSAAASLERDDPDARFQYMVPRRSPIRIENVPSDVCGGPANEWWTTAALWDLYDTHADGRDQAALEFKDLWTALKKGNGKPAVGSMVEAFELLRQQAPGDQQEALRQAMVQNTMLSTFAFGPR